MEKALENIPDLIISDVMMPEKDGYEVCDTLKNDERTSHIPIILLTAKADVESKIAGLKRGADVYLAKPFDKEELLIRLDKMVEKQKNLSAYFTKKIPIGRCLVYRQPSAVHRFRNRKHLYSKSQKNRWRKLSGRLFRIASTLPKNSE